MRPPLSDEALLSTQQRRCFDYFLRAVHQRTGLCADALPHHAAPQNQDWNAQTSASIAATGYALAAFCIGAERGYMARRDALTRVLSALRFLDETPSRDVKKPISHRGFFFHFLEMESGARVRRCELSPLDSALFFAGAFFAANYFDGDNPREREVRERAAALFARADWRWMRDEKTRRIFNGWAPERGFTKYAYGGYDETLLMQLLALGAPEYSMSAESYAAYWQSYKIKTFYGIEYLYAGPLFLHTMTPNWIDLRGVHDDFWNCKNGDDYQNDSHHQNDYHQNARRAVWVQREYAQRNARGFRGYGKNFWGFSACDGPGARHFANGKRCFGYKARGAPYGPDDGTIAPMDVLAALPFAPEEVLETLHHFHHLLSTQRADGFVPGAMNASLGGDELWISPRQYGIENGLALLAIENYRSGLPHEIMARCDVLQRGLNIIAKQKVATFASAETFIPRPRR